MGTRALIPVTPATENVLMRCLSDGLTSVVMCPVTFETAAWQSIHLSKLNLGGYSRVSGGKCGKWPE
jgi:hypothetical protein